MRTIAISLCDNDFWRTFTALLETVHRALSWDKALTREDVTRLIHSGIPFHYLAFQLGSDYGAPGYPDVGSTIEYLSRIEVLFDEEAEAHIQNHDHDGGSWYLEVLSGNVHSY